MGEEGDLRVFWMSNLDTKKTKITMKVKDFEQANLVLETLTKYDLDLGDLIDSNVGMVEVFEDGEWCDSSEYEDYETNRSDAACKGE